MNRKQVGDPSGGEVLAIYNSGASRSRITLVTTGGPVTDPLQLAGTRWIVFGDQAAAALHQLILDNSYLKLHELIPGGFSSSTWQDMHRTWDLLPPEIGMHGDLEFLNFGHLNSRVLLLRSGTAFAPERIEGTNIIALSPRALDRYGSFLDTLPARTAAAHAAAAAVVPGGLAGTALTVSRRHFRKS
jgi:hypothetical protein